MVKQEWILKRNCSISPRQLGFFFALLCLTSLLVAAFFALHGAWYVLWFAWIDLLAVGWAFLLFARHATDRERIVLADESLLVELIQVERVQQFSLNVHRLRVQLPAAGQELVCLESNGTCIEVGRFLTEWRRREFALELQHALASNG
ncbi:MAG TPA: DUF2244 domain-containing protein [Paucimonas sp.]|nr:DUF2244 domain-containing protein [Paucimonas sp.]HJW56434.1 DUF2244 domain-containing protein [Burkholderiaceae bacterium]